MGIRGLTTFVALCGLCEHKTKKFLPSSAQQAKLKIVIDGGALIHHIYFAKKIDFISGGQFDQFEHEATSFFNALIHAGFAPYVIFDGIVQECIVRMNSAIHSVVNQLVTVDSAPTKQVMNSPILPILAQHTLVHVLNTLKVPYSVSDYEADAVAGTHANKNGCAVLSKDSDFYVFPVAQGYKLTFDFYKTESILELLKLKAELLPAFASLCGNDFVSRENLWGFHMYLRNEYPPHTLNVPDSKCLDIARVGKFLSNYKTQEEAFEAAAEASNAFLGNAKKLAEEKELARQAAEAERQAEEAKKAEEAKLAAEAKRAEEALRAEELRKEQEASGQTAETAPAPEQQTKEEVAIAAITESTDNIDLATESVDKEPTKEEKQSERDRILEMDPAERKKQFLELLNHSAEQYVAQNITVGKETSLTLHPQLVPRYFNNSAIALNLLHSYRQFLFNDELMGVLTKLTVWLNSIVENTARAKSAWAVGLTLRKLTYGILCGGGEYATDPASASLQVTEYVREAEKYVTTKVSPTYLLNGKKLPSLPVVMQMPPKVRLTIFLEMLSSNAPAVVEFEAWTFGIAALRAFIVARAEEKDRKLQDWEVLNFVTRPPFGHSIALRHQQSLPRSREQLHFLAEWRIYNSVLACNSLLNPIAVPSPSALYDGEMGKNNDYKKVMLKKPQDIELFDKIYTAVTTGIEDKLARKVQVANEADEKKKEIIEKMESKKNAVENKKKAAVKENMFDMLADDEEPKMTKSNSKKAAAKKK